MLYLLSCLTAISATMQIKRLIKTLFHPTTIKIVAVIFIVWYFFILPTYAADNKSLAEFKTLLSNILSLCSWLWIILAVLAGKLMTNDRVYGAVLHMDIYLRRIWNIMKNFANFGLVAIVLRSIVKNLIGKEKMDVKKIITKTLIAGILIQASWFLVWAAVDISTVATSAIGAFPASFLKSDAKLEEHIRNTIIQTPKDIVIDMNKLEDIKLPDNERANPETRNSILPTYKSVSGPLMYFGFSVFKFQNYLNVENISTGTEITLAFLLRFSLILAYTLWLALLFIANIIRVVFLWIFIIAAPLLILAQIFKDSLGWGTWASWWMTKYLKFSVMLDMIFKPIIYMAGFSIMLILVASMQNIMQTRIPQEFNGVVLSVTGSTAKMEIEEISSIQINENNVFWADKFAIKDAKEIGQTIFVNLILFFLLIFLLRQFIKISLTAGEWPIQDVMKNITWRIEDVAKTLPIIPIAWGQSLTAAWQFMKSNRKQILQGLWVSEAWEFGQLEEGSFVTNQEAYRDYLNQQMGHYPGWWEKDKAKLKTEAKIWYQNFFSKTTELAKERDWGLNVTNAVWNQPFLELARGDNSKLRTTVSNTIPAWDWSESFDEYMKGRENITINAIPAIKWLYDQLWWSTAASTSSIPTTYEDLKKITFHNPGKKKP